MLAARDMDYKEKNTTKKTINMKTKIPRFKSKSDEEAFWETHSVADYAGDLRKIDDLFVLAPALSEKIRERAKKKSISIRLAQWEIESAKRIAKARKMPYQRLLREWIDRGIKGNLESERGNL